MKVTQIAVTVSCKQYNDKHRKNNAHVLYYQTKLKRGKNHKSDSIVWILPVLIY